MDSTEKQLSEITYWEGTKVIKLPEDKYSITVGQAIIINELLAQGFKLFHQDEEDFEAIKKELEESKVNWAC